jgi:hypothetical protein
MCSHGRFWHFSDMARCPTYVRRAIRSRHRVAAPERGFPISHAPLWLRSTRRIMGRGFDAASEELRDQGKGHGPVGELGIGGAVRAMKRQS